MKTKIAQAVKPAKETKSVGKTAKVSKPAVVKETAATAARKKNPKITKLLAENNQTAGKTKLDKNLIPKVAEYASSFNWWLDSTTNENWAYAHNIFTPEECKKIIEVGTGGRLASPLTYGTVGDLNQSESDIEKVALVRKSPVAWIRSDIQENHWIFQRMRDAVKNINDQFFNYELSEIQSLQFTSYDGKESGFYGKHIDMMYQGTGTRKLSVSIQLSDSGDYEGGDLLLHTRDDPERPHRQQGTGIFFPGYTLHEVTPVTKGKRYSLVAWILGPRFK
jgi:PKHD-type hydroxylase